MFLKGVAINGASKTITIHLDSSAKMQDRVENRNFSFTVVSRHLEFTYNYARGMFFNLIYHKNRAMVLDKMIKLYMNITNFIRMIYSDSSTAARIST